MNLFLFLISSFLTKVSYRDNNNFKVKLPCSLKYSTNQINCHFILNDKVFLPTKEHQKKYSNKSFLFHFECLEIPNGTYVTDFICDIKAVGHKMKRVNGLIEYEPLYENNYSEKHRVKLIIENKLIKEMMTGFY